MELGYFRKAYFKKSKPIFWRECCASIIICAVKGTPSSINSFTVVLTRVCMSINFLTTIKESKVKEINTIKQHMLFRRTKECFLLLIGNNY